MQPSSWRFILYREANDSCNISFSAYSKDCNIAFIFCFPSYTKSKEKEKKWWGKHFLKITIVKWLKNAEGRLKNLMVWIFLCQNAWLKNQTCQRLSFFWSEKMFKNRLLETAKRSKNGDKPEVKTLQAMTKIRKHKRLSSQEFQNVYDAIWQEGPKTEYKNPDSWRSSGDSS